MNRLNGKVCIVTGSTSGIGLETAKALASMGATVVLVARDAERGKCALKTVIDYSHNMQCDLLLCDFSSQPSIVHFCDAFKKKYSRLDVLINNAGVINSQRCETEAGIELTFAVNHLGYFLTTNLLLNMLVETPSSRIVVVSSDLHERGRIDFRDLMQKYHYNGFSAYANSKLANVLFTYQLHEQLKRTDTAINALHPGVIKTKIGVADRNSNQTFPMGIISPEQGAKASIYLSSSPEVQGVSGRYFNQMRMEKSSHVSYDKGLADTLWQKSLALTQ